MVNKSSSNILEELLAVDRRAPASPPSLEQPSEALAEPTVPEASATPVPS